MSPKSTQKVGFLATFVNPLLNNLGCILHDFDKKGSKKVTKSGFLAIFLDPFLSGS